MSHFDFVSSCLFCPHHGRISSQPKKKWGRVRATSKKCVGRARVGPGRHDQLMPKKQIVGQGSELVPGGGISSDHPKQKFMKILERPELVPGRGISSEQLQ